MTDCGPHVDVDCETGAVSGRPLTTDEIAARDALAAQEITERHAVEAAAARRTADLAIMQDPTAALFDKLAAVARLSAG